MRVPWKSSSWLRASATQLFILAAAASMASRADQRAPVSAEQVAAAVVFQRDLRQVHEHLHHAVLPFGTYSGAHDLVKIRLRSIPAESLN